MQCFVQSCNMVWSCCENTTPVNFNQCDQGLHITTAGIQQFHSTSTIFFDLQSYRLVRPDVPQVSDILAISIISKRDSQFTSTPLSLWSAQNKPGPKTILGVELRKSWHTKVFMTGIVKHFAFDLTGPLSHPWCPMRSSAFSAAEATQLCVALWCGGLVQFKDEESLRMHGYDFVI